jgi:hypothetical protein
MTINFTFSDPLSWYRIPGAWFIRVVDGGQGSHFSVGVSGSDDIYVYEAVIPRSRVVPMKSWLGHNKVKVNYMFQVPKEIEADVIRFLDSLIRVPYSVPQLILIFLCKMLFPTNILLKGAIINHERALICTEVGSRFIEKFMNYKLTKSHDNTGVKDIQMICEGLVLQDKEWKVQL